MRDPDMNDTKVLGRTGIRIPVIGLGAWDYHAGPGPLRRGLEAGALFVDTAESYGTEATVGQAIQGIRDRVFVATKVSPQNFRPADLKRSVDRSLLHLGVDAIDLMQLHQPNPDIPIAETMGALSECVDAGKVRYVGVSNFAVPQLEEALRAAGRNPIVSNQVRYSLIDRTIEQDILPFCRANGITVIAYSPLGRMFQRILDCDPGGCISQIAARTSKSPAQVVLNWCISQEGVVAIPKGNSEAHILDNCAAAGWRLSAEDVELLNTKIQFRRRGRLDQLVRRYMPASMRNLAVQALGLMPRGIRRRMS